MSIVVITGGTAGVGRATAERFAQAGFDVAVIARSEAGLAETVKNVEKYAVRALGISADVADARQVTQAADRIDAELGPPDVWINCAMCTVLAPFDAFSDDEYRRVTDVTYLGSVNGTREALRLMKPRNKGIIIQVGSALAYRSIPLQSAYCAAKAAIRGFTDSLRCELIHEKSAVRLTMVQLPGINTPQFDWARNKLDRPLRPVAPVYQPEVAANAIFNASQRNVREVWVGKTSFQSIVGHFLFPDLLDKMMAKQAWEGQKESAPTTTPKPDYLDKPVEGLHQAHGRFDHEAKEKAITVDARLPGNIVLTVAGLALLALCKRYGKAR